MTTLGGWGEDTSFFSGRKIQKYNEMEMLREREKERSKLLLNKRTNGGPTAALAPIVSMRRNGMGNCLNLLFCLSHETHPPYLTGRRFGGGGGTVFFLITKDPLPEI